MPPAVAQFRVHHSKWVRREGTMVQCVCHQCGWSFMTTSRPSATRAAGAHVRERPGHTVATTKTVMKLTTDWRVTS